MPPLTERPHDKFHRLETGATRCHEVEFCFFVDRNFKGFMIYGNNSGDYCVDQDLAWSGGSFHEQTSSCINNTNYRIRVYDDPPGSPRQLLWTMPPRYSVDYMLEASPTIQKLTSQFKEGTVGKHSSLSLRDRGPPTLCRSRCGIRAGTLNTTAGGI